MEPVLAIIGGLIAIGSVLATAVWAVGKIDTTTAVLGNKIDNLSGSVTRLDGGIENLRKDLRDVDSRVTRIEAANARARE